METFEVSKYGKFWGKLQLYLFLSHLNGPKYQEKIKSY